MTYKGIEKSHGKGRILFAKSWIPNILHVVFIFYIPFNKNTLDLKFNSPEGAPAHLTVGVFFLSASLTFWEGSFHGKKYAEKLLASEINTSKVCRQTTAEAPGWIAMLETVAAEVSLPLFLPLLASWPRWT